MIPHSIVLGGFGVTSQVRRFIPHLVDMRVATRPRIGVAAAVTSTDGMATNFYGSTSRI